MPRALAAGLTVGLFGAVVAGPSAGASTPGADPNIGWGHVRQVWDRGAEGYGTQIVTFAGGNTMAIWNPVNGSGIWTSIKRHGGAWSSPRMVGSAILGPAIVPYANRVLMFWENSTGAYSRSVYSGGSSGPLVRVGGGPRVFVNGTSIGRGQHDDLVGVWPLRYTLRLVTRERGGHSWSSPETVPVHGVLGGLAVQPSGSADLAVLEGTASEHTGWCSCTGRRTASTRRSGCSEGSSRTR